jgi:alanine-glyoxylate transaminase/serine-glyoxylate transaminase/serine-pyruvate transaminase
VKVDDWKVDICYSGTQKCLSVPPGLSPITFSPKAMEILLSRKTKIPSWYLDMTMVSKYWGSERVYHHTAPISMIYALREGLRLIYEEDIDNVITRHKKNHDALVAGLEAMGLEMLVEKDIRLPMLNTVKIPDGLNDPDMRKELLTSYDIEIGGGLGVLKGKIWRIGLMGYSSKVKNVLNLLTALESALSKRGAPVTKGASVEAANRVYNNA